MLLERSHILELIEEGKLRVEPFEERLLGNDSLDVRLGGEILVSKPINEVVDAHRPPSFWERRAIGDGFILYPGQFILGSTLERIALPNSVAAFIEGKSSVGRLGIMVHVTAGVIHAGFGSKGPSTITLEIYSVNPNPVRIYEGMPIAQLTFHPLSREGYAYDERGSYVGQQGPLPPKGLRL